MPPINKKIKPDKQQVEISSYLRESFVLIDNSQLINSSKKPEGNSNNKKNK